MHIILYYEGGQFSLVIFKYYLEKVLSLQYYKRITIGDKVLVRHTYKQFLLYGDMEMHLHLG